VPAEEKCQEWYRTKHGEWPGKGFHYNKGTVILGNILVPAKQAKILFMYILLSENNGH